MDEVLKEREDHAIQVFGELGKKMKKNCKFAEQICVVIPTVPRKRKYLSISTSRLLEGCETAKINFIIDRDDLRKHEEATNILSTLPNVEMHTIRYPNQDVSYHYWVKKQNFMHAQALRYCLQKEPEKRYILFLQDDAYPTNSFVDKIQKSLNFIGSDYWGGIKFYASDTWCGWERKDMFHLGIFLLFIGVSLSIALFQCGRVSPLLSVEGFIFILILALTVSVLVGNVLLSLLVIGKQNIFPRIKGVRRLSIDKEIIGTWTGNVGNLYNYKYVSEFIQKLENHNRNTSIPLPDDAITREWSKDSKIPWYIVFPNLVQHIGHQSSAFTKNQKHETMNYSGSFRVN